jgi:hypothetical protein
VAEKNSLLYLTKLSKMLNGIEFYMFKELRKVKTTYSKEQRQIKCAICQFENVPMKRRSATAKFKASPNPSERGK